MISWRLAASLTPPNAILVPGTTPRGSARYLSRLAWFQTRPDSFIASLESKPGTVAALSPQIPASDGPMPFLPGSTEWQALHCANEAGSAMAAGAAAVVALALGVALGVGVGLGDSLGVGVAVGVSPGAGVAGSAGMAVSTASGAAPAGCSVSSAPPPHAARARRAGASATAAGAIFIEKNPFGKMA